MSFRYTNSLVGVMKHRILLEKGRRELLSKTFTGRCDGITVQYSAYGTILSIAIDPEAKTNYMLDGKIDTSLLSTSVRTAVWDANQQLIHAKEEIHRRSISGNKELKANPNMKLWYEHNGTSLRPLPFEALSRETGATEWMKEVRGDVQDAPVTLSSTNRAFCSGLAVIEDDRSVLAEQRKMMAERERNFWKSVELIRKGQVANIDGEKRGYKDEMQRGAGSTDNASQKVVLKFVQ